MTAAFVHPTAECEEGSSIGEGTRVWHHCHIRAGAIIGAACNIGKSVFVDEGVVIGSRVKIQNNVSVYRGVRISDEVFVGPSAVFTNDRMPRATSTTWNLVTTTVHHGSSIGANATIVCGNDVGAYAMVGAGSVVTSSVGAHEVVVGNPARRLGWVCRCGTTFVRTLGPRPEITCPDCEGAVDD